MKRVTCIASGLMLLWPLIQRRLSPVKEIGTLNVTQLINRENAVLLKRLCPSGCEELADLEAAIAHAPAKTN